ncbi:MAG: putative Rossmann-fold nucleotide-binding protein [Maribacter sp.]|jgi:predicted Rossmann-fold nucleotide-binding protein
MHEYESLKELRIGLPRMPLVQNGAFQKLDLNKIKDLILNTKFKKCLFLGCKMDKDIIDHLMLKGHNSIFSQMDVPFKIYQSKLYSPKSIYKGYQLENPDSYHNTYDKRVYNHYMANGAGEPETIYESLARRIHDHSITDAIEDFIRGYDDKKIVAIMGGHSLKRNAKDYLNICLISKKLTEAGYLMISGGGPGAMEATHVGAWFAGRTITDLKAGIKILKECPSYTPQENWLNTAFRVINDFPQVKKHQSLGIPTWLYGHEPPTPFATKIAKYFANSVREEGLLAIAKGGVIYSPGSAGTIQEIFQDACQNHYISYEHPSPMVFMNTKYWNEDRPIYPLLEQMAKDKKYKNLILSISDSVEDVVVEILKFE